MSGAALQPAPTSHNVPFRARDSFSVVICTYTEKRWAALRAAVRSVIEQTLPPLETIVVADHNDRLLERIRRELPGVRAIPNRHDRGLSGARNSAIEVARGGALAFLDDDAVASPDWLRHFADGFAEPGIVGVGGRTRSVWEAGRPAWFPEEFDWVVGGSYRGLPTRRAAVRNLHGGNMALRREAFDAVGGFVTSIGRIGTRPLGCEETELCIRINQSAAGGPMLYEPRATIDHGVPAVRSTWRYFMERCYAEGLSKAMVARHVGAADGLASERSFASRTLPAAIGRNALVTLRGDAAGPGRIAALVLGLGAATVGYVRALATMGPA